MNIIHDRASGHWISEKWLLRMGRSLLRVISEEVKRQSPRRLLPRSLGRLRQGEANETRISADCWSTRRASGEFLLLDAAVSSADTGWQWLSHRQCHWLQS